MGFLTFVAACLLLLKLAGLAKISWCLVLLPLGINIALAVIVAVTTLIITTWSAK